MEKLNRLSLGKTSESLNKLIFFFYVKISLLSNLYHLNSIQLLINFFHFQNNFIANFFINFLKDE